MINTNLKKLSLVSSARPLKALSKKQFKELQRGLLLAGYPAGKVDGLIGPRTRNAWGEFREDYACGDALSVDIDSITALQELIDVPRDQYDFSTKEGTIKAIIAECQAQQIHLPKQISYGLATAKWETNHTFKPVREAYWLSEEWRQKNLRYWPYYGRGFVQITWLHNYKKYSDILGIDLVKNPDLALNPEIAVFTLVHGFKTGAFTGRKITDYLDTGRTDFINARRCINGIDKAEQIAGIARQFLVDLDNAA